MIFKISIGSLCLFKERLLKDVRDMNQENVRIIDGRQSFNDLLYGFYPSLLQGSFKNYYLMARIIYQHRRSNTCRDIKPIQERIGFDRHMTCCRLSGLTYRLMDRSSCIPAASYTANGGLSDGIAASVVDDGLRVFVMSAISDIPGRNR